MLFTSAALRKRLSSMDLSQASINGVSRWVLESIPSRLGEMLAVWEHEFRQGNLQYRKLLLYVANDMIQLPSQHQDLIVSEFTKKLELAFWLLAGAKGGVKEIERLPAVWNQRNIFHPTQIERFAGILDGTAPQPLEFMEIEQPQSVDDDLNPMESNEVVVQSLVAMQRRDVASTLGEDAVQSAHVKIQQLVENESISFELGEKNDGSQYEIIKVDPTDVKRMLLLHREKLRNTVSNRKGIVNGLKQLQDRLEQQVVLNGEEATQDGQLMNRCSDLLKTASQAWDDVGSLVTAQAKRQRQQNQQAQPIQYGRPLPVGSIGNPQAKRPRYDHQPPHPSSVVGAPPPSLAAPSLAPPLAPPPRTHPPLPQPHGRGAPAYAGSWSAHTSVATTHFHPPPTSQFRQPTHTTHTTHTTHPPVHANSSAYGPGSGSGLPPQPLQQPQVNVHYGGNISGSHSYPPLNNHTRPPPRDVAPYRPPGSVPGRLALPVAAGLDVQALSNLLASARSKAAPPRAVPTSTRPMAGRGRGRGSTLPAWMTEGK